jgi:hypothetical protein
MTFLTALILQGEDVSIESSVAENGVFVQVLLDTVKSVQLVIGQSAVSVVLKNEV